MPDDELPWSRPDADIIGDIRRLHDANPPRPPVDSRDKWAAYCAPGHELTTALYLMLRPPEERIVSIAASQILTGTDIILVNLDRATFADMLRDMPVEMDVQAHLADLAAMRERREREVDLRWLKLWPR